MFRLLGYYGVLEFFWGNSTSLVQYPKMINILCSVRYIPYSAREAREKFLDIMCVSKVSTLLCVLYCMCETRKQIFCYYGVLQLEKKVATAGYYNFLSLGVLQKKTLCIWHARGTTMLACTWHA